MILIDNQIELEKICHLLGKQRIISVDTEFQRTNTYYAKLSLVQIVCIHHQIIIDALADLDLTPLKELFGNVEILKIFHAPRQDFEIFYNIFGAIPVNIADTQIAAEVSGKGKSLSYRDLCWQICQVSLDKTNQFSNWLRRPISAEKLNYAINDVLYLKKIHISLHKIIAQNKLEPLYAEKLNQLVSIDNYKFDSSKAWKKVKYQKSSLKFNKHLQEIAAFREESARLLDIPRGHFLTDLELITICKFLPKNELELKKLNIKSRYLQKNKFNLRLQEICAALREIEGLA